MGKNNNNKNSGSSTQQKPSSSSSTATAPATSSSSSSSQQPTTTTTSSSKFQIPKASPIANYSDDKLTDREKFLLSKMENMKLYKPKELPKPRLNRNRGWFHVLLEKYNIETALYMIEPWERWILNTLLILFFMLIGYWVFWAYEATIENYNEFVIPAVAKIREIISS